MTRHLTVEQALRITRAALGPIEVRDAPCEYVIAVAAGGSTTSPSVGRGAALLTDYARRIIH